MCRTRHTPLRGSHPIVTDVSSDPLERALSWFRAHEFPDADVVAFGSSVISAGLLRGRVWVNQPSSPELDDLVGATPEESWCAAILVREPDEAIGTAATMENIALLLLGGDGAMHHLNDRGRQLVEWVAARQRAQSFATRALHALAAEGTGADGDESAVGSEEPGTPDSAADVDDSALPVRGAKVARGVHDAPLSPQMAARAAVEDPELDPDPQDLTAATEEQRKRIEDMRQRRQLRKSVKHR